MLIKCFLVISFFLFFLRCKEKGDDIVQKARVFLGSFMMQDNKIFWLVQILSMISVGCKNTRTIANHSVLPLAVAIYNIGSYTKKATNSAFYKFDDEYG